MKKWKLVRSYILTGVLSAAMIAGGSTAAMAEAMDVDNTETPGIVELEAAGDSIENQNEDAAFDSIDVFSGDENDTDYDGGDDTDYEDEDIFFDEGESYVEEGETSAEAPEGDAMLLTTGENPSTENPSAENGASGELTPTMSWKYDQGVLTISGSGDMPDFTGPDQTPWYAYLQEIVKVVVEENVTSVGNFAFSSASLLSEVDLPSTLKKIGDSAFASCQILPSVVIPAGVATIGDKAFTNCVKLASITIPASVTAIGPNAFAGSTLVVIKGNFGSYAEKYAKEKGIPFVPAVQTSLSGAAVTLSQTVYNYSGSACTPAVTVVMSVTPLKKDTDYTVAYANNINAGTATVTLTGKGNYKDAVSRTYKINSISLAGASVSGITDKTYTGAGVTQAPTVVLAGKKLVPGTDYVLTYANNIKIGTATVTITGRGNYNGAISRQFKIKKASVSKASVTNVKNKIYTGKKQTQKPVVVVAGRTLKKGTDYTIKYKNNVKIGTATMIIKGKGNYTGSIKKKFKIRKATVADATIKGIQDKQYTGQPITLDLKVKIGKKTLQKGTDYTVSYSNNVNVGTATVTVKGKGNYKGKTSRQFDITKASIDNASIKNVTDKPYTGKPQKQDPVITVSGRTLKQGSDYTLSYENNVEIGTATMIITAKGNYTGKRRVSFQIKLLSIKDARVSGIQDKEYTGDEVTQSITVTLNGNTLKKGKDYNVSYNNNVSVGRAFMQISGTGSYTGALTAGFNILPRKTTVTSASIDGTKMTVKWVAREGIVDGYQVQYSTDRSFSDTGSIKTFQVPGDKANSYFFTVTAGKRYYVRVRTYKNVSGDLYYSLWSPVA